MDKKSGALRVAAPPTPPSSCTLDTLLTRFNAPVVSLDAIAPEFFGLCKQKARDHAALELLPVPTFRLRDSQKAPLLVHVVDLARWIDTQHAAAAAQWKHSQLEEPNDGQFTPKDAG